MSSNMLINENPLMVLPSLVKRIGLPRAIILQQFHFMAQMPRSGKDFDGYHWVWGTYEELAETQFGGIWKPDWLRRQVKQLEKDGLLISSQPMADKWDRTKYYRVNYDVIDAVINHQTDAEEKCQTDAEEKCRIEAEGNHRIFYIETETTTETTADDSKQSESDTDTHRMFALLESEWPGGVSGTQIENHRHLIEIYGFEAWRQGFMATKRSARHVKSYVEKVIISEVENKKGNPVPQRQSRVDASMQAVDDVVALMEKENVQSWQ